MEYEDRKKEIQARFTKLREEGKSDIKINKADLNKSFDTTEKIMKWLDHRVKWLSLHHSFEYKRREAWKKAFEYYKTDYPFTLNTKEEYQNMINTDPAYFEIADISNLTSMVIDYIDETIANLKSRQFEVKNYIEWQKFQHGL